MPPEPALLAEAAHWVDSWQEPTGHTNYDAALQMAERYMEADCEYIFSDGLSDYAVVLLEVNSSTCPCFALQYSTAQLQVFYICWAVCEYRWHSICCFLEASAHVCMYFVIIPSSYHMVP